MKNLFCFFPLLLLTFSFASCNGKTYEKENISDANFTYVHLIPDSLRTPEQKELYLLLEDVVKKKVVVENNRFVLGIARNEFIKKGIPSEYYDLLEKNIKENNDFISSFKIDSIEKLWKDAIDDRRVIVSLINGNDRSFEMHEMN